MFDNEFIRVSSCNPRYFEYESGAPFLPIGVNLCFQRYITDDGEALAMFEKEIRHFAENGGNLIRVWCGVALLNLEPEQEGMFSAEKLENMKALVAIAKKNHVRIKFTLEHFRTVTPRKERELFTGAVTFQQPIYHTSRGGSCENMTDYFTKDAPRKNLLKKLEILSREFAGEPAIMGWELWNELNAVDAPRNVWLPWLEMMVAEMHRLFPRQLIMQSLGSFDCLESFANYAAVGRVPGIDVGQIHRYLQPGADLDICRGALDLLEADATRETLELFPERPVFVAETGAAAYHHSGPSHLYEQDRAGILLFDGVFTPFFCGVAGCGHFWHWDQFYIGLHDHWKIFSLFAETVAGVDPVRENFTVHQRESGRLRFYGLSGRTQQLWLLRDKRNDWQHEFNEGIAPELLAEMEIPLAALTSQTVSGVSFFAPWDGTRGALAIHDGKITLPRFHRALILKIQR